VFWNDLDRAFQITLPMREPAGEIPCGSIKSGRLKPISAWDMTKRNGAMFRSAQPAPPGIDHVGQERGCPDCDLFFKKRSSTVPDSSPIPSIPDNA
jgi:hypothetical protein